MKKYFLLVLALFVALYNSNSSVAIDDAEVGRGSDLKIADNKKAFIGIDYKERYSIVQGGEISFNIKNNFPDRAEFILELDGDIISKYNPESFVLSPYGEKEKIEIATDKNAIPGTYWIEGSIIAEFDDGRSEVEISTEVEIKEPEPEEVISGEMIDGNILIRPTAVTIIDNNPADNIIDGITRR